jgi:hypothetical protein
MTLCKQSKCQDLSIQTWSGLFGRLAVLHSERLKAGFFGTTGKVCLIETPISANGGTVPGTAHGLPVVDGGDLNGLVCPCHEDGHEASAVVFYHFAHAFVCRGLLNMQPMLASRASGLA